MNTYEEVSFDKEKSERRFEVNKNKLYKQVIGYILRNKEFIHLESAFIPREFDIKEKDFEKYLHENNSYLKHLQANFGCVIEGMKITEDILIDILIQKDTNRRITMSRVLQNPL